MEKGALLVTAFLLLPALFLPAAGREEKGPFVLTLWYPAGEITAASMPFRDGSWMGAFVKDNSLVISKQVRGPREAPNLSWAFSTPPATKPGGKPSAHIAAWEYSVFTQGKHKDLALPGVMEAME